MPQTKHKSRQKSKHKSRHIVFILSLNYSTGTIKGLDKLQLTKCLQGVKIKQYQPLTLTLWTYLMSQNQKKATPGILSWVYGIENGDI